MSVRTTQLFPHLLHSLFLTPVTVVLQPPLDLGRVLRLSPPQRDRFLTLERGDRLVISKFLGTAKGIALRVLSVTVF